VIAERVEELRDANDRLDTLPKPTGDERVLGEIDEMRDDVIGLFERLGVAIQDRDKRRAQTLADEARSVQDELSAVDLGFGFKVCGQD
jgi:hypothetical protein